MAMFGLMALLLSAIGVYGVMSYSVSQRIHEIGVRLALGAQPGDVRRMVTRQALKLTGTGLAIGLPVALGLGRVMASALFGVVSLDLTVFAAFTLALAFVAFLSSYLPARRASKVDPIIALRYE
jgi:putative ABC transport system permease protein